MSSSKEGRHVRKVIRAVEKDDVPKIRYYTKKYNINLASIVTEDGTLLHLSCKKGHDACMRYLLKKGVNPCTADRNGDLPIHVAISRALNGRKHAYSDLVHPLLIHSPQCLDCANLAGITPRQLLKELEDANRHSYHGYGASKKKQRMSSGTSEEHDEWSQKLRDEAAAEYGQSWGTYENDFCDIDKEPETYDSWAEKMSSQYHTKHTCWRKVSSKTTTKAAQDEKEEQQRQFEKEKAEQAHREYMKRAEEQQKREKKEKCNLLKRDYEEKYEEIASSTCQLSYRDIPWPDHRNSPSLEDVLFADVDLADKTMYKKCLRTQQIRWHPDRFMQKFGDRLRKSDTSRILKRVNAISQILNQLSSQDDV